MRHLARIGAFLLGLLVASPAFADESILLFDSTVTVEPDADLLVTESITVKAEGYEIRRGIYRDFPTTYRKSDGSVSGVGFELLEVTRDGSPEPHHTEGIAGGIRIYAGSADVVLQPGIYTYVFRYRTSRQVRYFADYDEVYWNVTGNFWNFPIERAVVRIVLPEGARILQKAAYTGSQGAPGRDARVVSESDRQVVFETTRRLSRNEGLTVAVAFPTGLVAKPGPVADFAWSLWDNIGLVGLITGTLLAAFYYLRTWNRVGRDPQGGVIIPLFSPPEALSPAALSYVHYQGFDKAAKGAMRAFMAAIMSLAVKGRLRIDATDENKTALVAAKSSSEPLSGGEAVIMDRFLAGRDRFEFVKANGTTIASAQSAFRSAIQKEHEGKFFKDNLGYFTIGAILSVAAAACYLFFQPTSDETKTVIVFTFVLALAGSLLLSMGWRRLLGWVPGGSSKIAGVLLAILGAVVFGLSLAVPFWSGALLTGGVACAIALAVVNVAFFHLLRAPTVVGRKVMDQIEGFRLYLSVAEAERMNLVGGPQMSVELFEKFLPFAVALGVERPWSEAFESWLKHSAPDTGSSSGYSPRWYSGSSWSNASLGRATGAVVSSMAAGMASAMPSKSSSGSGGGGFSGGGGGGGGGGGW
ncbi:MAG: DUF2207 domain-containing protein [Parvibaculaceae bacterium]